MILTDKDNFRNRYIRKKIGKYKGRKSNLIKSGEPIKGVNIRKSLHPLLMKALRMKSVLLGMKYEMVGENRVTVTDKPVIYAVTHIGKCDYEMVVEACDIFAYPFAGDWEMMYATVDDYFLRANGVLYVDTVDKEDRKNSFAYMIKALKQGVPMLIYPEGIWNLTENLPVMKIFHGAVQAARECRVPIVPIAVEQFEKRFWINVGEELQFEHTDEREAVQILRDAMATLKWEIWETFPKEKRENISEGCHEDFVRNRIAEFAGFDKQIIESRIYRDRTDRELEAIKKDIELVRRKCK